MNQERFTVVLAFEHPKMDPAIISSVLGYVPSNSWAAGGSRKTPTGTLLPGTRPSSMWTMHVDVVSSRKFSGTVRELVSTLEEQKEFLINFISEGGKGWIRIYLPGDVNIGDDIDWTILQSLASMKISLGIEVFPKFNVTPDVKPAH